MGFPTFKVELEIGADPVVPYLIFDDATRGRFDTGKFGTTSGVYTDVSAYVLGGSTKRGRQRLLEAYMRGTATVVLDNAVTGHIGDFDPNNLSGPYVSGGVSQLRPEIRLRITATSPSGTSWSQFLGFVDSFQVVYGHPQGSQVIVKATDGFKKLAQFDPPAASSPVGAGEATGTRIGRLLDLAGWPASDRDLDTGNSTMQASTLAQNALTEIQLTSDSEGGGVFVSAAGNVTFRRRHARYEAAVSNTAQVTFGDNAGEIHYESLDIPALDDALVKNSVSVAAVGDTAVSSSDATSQSRYFTRTWNRHDLIHNGGTIESQAYADREIFYFKDAEQRIDAIHLRGVKNSPNALWDAMYGLDFGYRIRVRRRPVGMDALDRQLFVEGIEQTFNKGVEEFTTVLSTSSASPYAVGAFIFDSATLGKFDTNTLGSY